MRDNLEETKAARKGAPVAREGAWRRSRSEASRCVTARDGPGATGAAARGGTRGTDAGAPYPCTMVPPQLEPLPAVQA